MENVKKRMKFDECFVVDAVGRLGGMALMWNSEVHILEICQTALTIEAHVIDPETQVDWWLIGIYASYQDIIRRNPWKVINRRKAL